MTCQFPRLPGVANHSKSLSCNSLGYDLLRPTHTQSVVRFGQHAHPQQVKRGKDVSECVPPWSVPYATASLLPTHPEGPGGAAPHAPHMFLQFKEGADLHKGGQPQYIPNQSSHVAEKLDGWRLYQADLKVFQETNRVSFHKWKLVEVSFPELVRLVPPSS